MTRRQLFTTPQVCRILGVTRQTLYDWDVTPDQRGPGEKGVLLFYRSTVVRLARDHNRDPDWGAA